MLGHSIAGFGDETRHRGPFPAARAAHISANNPMRPAAHFRPVTQPHQVHHAR